jgi:hypothetical protein
MYVIGRFMNKNGTAFSPGYFRFSRFAISAEPNHLGSMMCQISRVLLLGYLVFWHISATSIFGQDSSNVDESGFRSIFDGKTLDGWRSVPKKNQTDWSIREGKIIGKGSQNKLVYLVWKEEVADFELKMQYRLITKGNSGVEIRSQIDRSGKRPFVGYHADFGHIGIGDNVLGAWDFHFVKRKEYLCKRGTNLVIDAMGKESRTRIDDSLTINDIHSRNWNRLHIIADGNRCWFSINGKAASEFTDQTSERLKKGWIGLQIHDAGMIVEFKDIRLKKRD